MTKLFSMKSLAFAGAAAFALTLAAAPQADAAETTTAKAGIAFQQTTISSAKTYYDSEEKWEADKKVAEQKNDKSVCFGWEWDRDGKLEDEEGQSYGNKLYYSYEVTEGDDVSAYWASVVVSRSAVNITSDGQLEYYYGTGKGTKIPTKWTVISTSSYKTDINSMDYWDSEKNALDEDSFKKYGNVMFTVPVQEIAKGKETNIYISADSAGELQTKAIACKAAPKLKASLNVLTSGSSIKLEINKVETKTGTFGLKSQYDGFSLGYYNDGEGEYGINASYLDENGYSALMKKLQQVADFGGATMTVYYASDDRMTPNATAKLKVSATPKAPKLSLKLTKFSAKFKATEKYRVYVDGTTAKELKNIKYATGDGSALEFEKLFGAANVSKSGNDSVLNDTVKIENFTFDKNGKKSDSRVTTTTVYKSAATPSAVNVDITNAVDTKKNTTGVSITFNTKDLLYSQNEVVSSGAVEALQYYDSTKQKWTDIKLDSSGKSQKAVTFKAGSVPDTLYVRLKAVDYTAANSKKGTKTSYYEAPGHVLTITLDKNDPANDSKYNYDGVKSATKGAITTATK